jgi:hypothetical protein
VAAFVTVTVHLPATESVKTPVVALMEQPVPATANDTAPVPDPPASVTFTLCSAVEVSELLLTDNVAWLAGLVVVALAVAVMPIPAKSAALNESVANFLK